MLQRLSLPLLAPDGQQLNWLGVSSLLSVIIAINSVALLRLMWKGRRGQRSYYRYVPTIGYNNLALISIVIAHMTTKPIGGLTSPVFFVPACLMLVANSLFWNKEIRKRIGLARLGGREFALHYFALMQQENMYELQRLLHDDIWMRDPMANGTVRGIVEIEQFFKLLDDQFATLDIYPQSVEVQQNPDGSQLLMIQWIAQGVTRNGAPVNDLLGTNQMHRHKGRIKSMTIDFSLDDLPPVQIFDTAESDKQPLSQPSHALSL